MPKARSPRHSSRSTRVKIVAARVGGALGILLGFGLLVAAIAQWSERTDYLAAPACGTAAPARCNRRAEALVLGKRIGGHRSDSYNVHLRVLDAPWPDPDVEVELPVPDHVWPRLRRGFPVTVLLWGHDVAAVEVDGARAETDDSPAIEPIQFAVYGLLVLVLGAFGVLQSLDRLDRAGPVAAPFVVATFGTALMMEPFDVYDPAALASGFALAAGGLGALVAIRGQVRR